MADRKSKECYRRIKLYGSVQGIGFRPYVAFTAQKYSVLGYVKNIGGTVELGAVGSPGNVDAFLEEVKNPDLPFAVVENVQVLDTAVLKNKKYDKFEIIKSTRETLSEGIFIPPDLPLCEKCEKEIWNVNSRRYKYPLNSCVSCGPRFSIIKTLPYDRENITMGVYEMCPKCHDEYTSDGNRRHHAQTIGCNDCGPFLIYAGRNGGKEREEAVGQATEDLLNGRIVAIKGIGGYHLACLPTDENALRALRKLKGREEKPFAVMFPNIREIKSMCTVSEQEEKLLKSAARPIVPLYRKKDTFNFQVSMENDTCGCFLPYTAMQIMILQRTGPLVMTSANYSSVPVIKSDDDIFDFFNSSKEPLFAGILYHKREILRSLDDSVAGIAAGDIQVIRRGRGYVPRPIPVDSGGEISILAAGGDLKNSFCLLSGGYAYLSQYIGDLEEEKNTIRFKESLRDYLALFEVSPDAAACDSHPLYFSSRMIKGEGLPVIEVQHHHGHIASVIAEHGLKGKVLGVAFDGTGYGTDKSIWGGEFLLCEGSGFKRAGHLKCFKQLGGDSSAMDAVKMANCILHSDNIDVFIGEQGNRELLLKALDHNVNTVPSSSMGRLFDAAAAILKICTRNSYEGKCAMLLEQAAFRGKCRGKKPEPMSFVPQWKDGMLEFSSEDVLKALLSSKDAEAAALGFHEAVAGMVARGCRIIGEKEDVRQVALSGGVFQNKILLESTVGYLREQGFEVFWNRTVPPNDGGLALGQAYIASLSEI